MEKLLTVDDFARALGAKATRVRLWLGERKISCYRIGAIIRIPYSELERIKTLHKEFVLTDSWSLSKDQIAKFKQPGVYVAWDSLGQCLYVGVGTASVYGRALSSSHHRSDLLDSAEEITFHCCVDVEHAENLEYLLIQQLEPSANGRNGRHGTYFSNLSNRKS